LGTAIKPDLIARRLIRGVLTKLKEKAAAKIIRIVVIGALIPSLKKNS
jgi:hypothetical protein